MGSGGEIKNTKKSIQKAKEKEKMKIKKKRNCAVERIQERIGKGRDSGRKNDELKPINCHMQRRVSVGQGSRKTGKGKGVKGAKGV